jgi:preprotein translocase subunit SecG
VTLIIILHVLTCIFLVGVILLQPGKSDAGIGFGSTSQSIFGSRGAGNILTRTTAIVAFLFLNTSFFLARARVSETSRSVIQKAGAPAEANPGASGAAPATSDAAPVTTAPSAGEKPAASSPEAKAPAIPASGDTKKK